MWISVSLSLLVKQCLAVANVASACDLVDPPPLKRLAQLFEKASPEDVLGIVGGKVHIFKEHVVFAEVAENVGVPSGVLKELFILYHLEVVIILVDCV